MNGESLGISKGELWEGICKLWRLELVMDNVGGDWSEFVNHVTGIVSDCISRTHEFL